MIQISEGLPTDVPVPPDVYEEKHLIPCSHWATVFPAREEGVKASSLFEFLTFS